MQTQMEQSAHTQTRPCQTLVLGLGNILLRDEGVGVARCTGYGKAHPTA